MNGRDLWNNIKCTNTHVMEVLEGEKREKGTERLFEERVAKKIKKRKLFALRWKGLQNMLLNNRSKVQIVYSPQNPCYESNHRETSDKFKLSDSTK